MNDLIKREDAINEIREVYEYEFPTASGAFDEFVTIIIPNILRNLPSAEPELKKGTSNNQVHLCNSCKYNYPECPNDANVIFGDGRGNDNICACSKYVAGSKKGKWVTYEYPDKENCFYLQCSICGKPAIWANGVSNFPPHFCPSCGAEMENHNDRISNF